MSLSKVRRSNAAIANLSLAYNAATLFLHRARRGGNPRHGEGNKAAALEANLSLYLPYFVYILNFFKNSQCFLKLKNIYATKFKSWSGHTVPVPPGLISQDTIQHS